MTLLGAETVGRAYGGGMLKLEPKRGRQPARSLPRAHDRRREALTDIRPQMATHLRNGSSAGSRHDWWTTSSSSVNSA